MPTRRTYGTKAASASFFNHAAKEIRAPLLSSPLLKPERCQKDVRDDVGEVDEQPPGESWLMATLIGLLLLVIALLFYPLRGQAEDSPQGHHPYHADFYSKWQRADGIPCCNDRDCRPATTRLRGETIQVLIDGEWVNVPSGAVRPYASPVLGDHVCAVRKNVLCIILGRGV
jgi:hypothetical protein